MYFAKSHTNLYYLFPGFLVVLLWQSEKRSCSTFLLQRMIANSALPYTGKETGLYSFSEISDAISGKNLK